jgi:hypothetical protein
MFEFTRRPGAQSNVTDTSTFHVASLARRLASQREAIDLSHLIDGSYAYHSSRELRWHLAERFGLSVGAVELREHA